MSFVFPGFLWALLALGIPVIIHLFNFRKTTRVYFSTTRYLKQIKEVSTARRRLKHLLILAARLLFLLFLVMAFAQPFLPAEQQSGMRNHIVFYLDNSLSMSARLEGSTRALDAGISHIQEVLRVMPPETRFKLLTNDFAPSSNTFKAKAEIEELLTQIRLSPISRQATEVFNRIHQDREYRDDMEVFWLSDFQQSTFDDPGQIDTIVQWQLIPLQSEAGNNVYVDSVYLANPFAIGSEQTQVNVRLRNDGSKDIESLNVRLAINGIQTATTSVSIGAGGTQVGTLDVNARLRGFNQAQVTFNDMPISFDNEFYFSLNYTQRIQVLEIKARPLATPVEYVFGNRELFNYRGFVADNFNYSLLSDADLVVVNGLDRFPSGLSAALRNFLDGGGSLLLIPGTSPDVNSYNELAGLAITVSNEDTMQELEAPSGNHPFFQGVFESSSIPLLMPQARRLISWGSDRSAILKFKNEQPFLSLFERNGMLYLLSSPLDPGYSSLSTNAFFVPVMYKIASGGRKDSGRLYYSLNEQFIEQPIDSLNSDEPLRMVGDVEVVPPQRLVNNRVYFDLPKFALNAGFYHVVSRQDTVNMVAFDLSKEESRMAQYPEPDLPALFGGGDNVRLLQTGSLDSFSNGIKARYLGRPLWKYAVALALLFLLAEVLLIRFMK